MEALYCKKRYKAEEVGNMWISLNEFDHENKKAMFFGS
jgi:hypothetical protein